MRGRQALQAIVGLGVAVGFLWLLFRSTPWAELAAAIRAVDLVWLLVAQVLLWGAYFARAQRWGYVVRAVHPASYRSLFSATQIGFLVNFSVPGRLGEIVRAYVLSRLSRIALARSMATVALDRVNDVIGMLAVVLVASLALAADVQARIPAGTFGNAETIVFSSRIVRPAAWLLTALVAGALVGLVLLYIRQEQVVGLARRWLEPLSKRLADRVAHILTGFAQGMHVFRSASDLARAVVWTLVTWGADVASVAAVLLAFGLDFPWYTPFVMLALISIVIAVPVTPGVVGQYHVPAVAGLLMTAPDMAPVTAKAVAIVDHLATMVPVAALGLYCLRREGLGLLEVVDRGARDLDGGGG